MHMTEIAFQELKAENSRLRKQLEVLKYRVQNLLGRDTINRLGLTNAEYRLAHLMANASPRVVTKQALLEARREETDYAADDVHIKIVDVLVCKIRQKLKGTGVEIKTQWGVGYVMAEDSADLFYQLTYPDTSLLTQPNKLGEVA